MYPTNFAKDYFHSNYPTTKYWSQLFVSINLQYSFNFANIWHTFLIVHILNYLGYEFVLQNSISYPTGISFLITGYLNVFMIRKVILATTDLVFSVPNLFLPIISN